MLPDAWLATLHKAHLGLTFGLLAVALLRRPWRRIAGAQAAYGLWGLPLGLTLAASLPAADALRITLPALQVNGVALHGAEQVVQAWASPMQFVWLLGLAITVGVLTVQHHGYQRRLTRRHDGTWRAPAGSSPGLLGAWRPRLVLPSDVRQRFSTDERRWILAHERIHAHRGDNLARLIATVLAVLAWFNPLVWWALGALRQDQELACDAAVMQRFPQCWRAYGLALLKLDGAPRLPPTASAWQSHHPLKERIMMLKTKTPTASARRWAGTALAATGLASLALMQTVVGAAPSTDKPALARVTPREACPQMPRPEMPANLNLKGDYQMTAKFSIGADGRPQALRIEGERARIAPFVGPIEQAIRSYQCKPALAGTEIEQQFSFKLD
jgi:beta-lactamase regulating signal transducer with metallopeptidase domain